MSHFSSMVTLVLASAENRNNILARYLGFRRQIIREERALERITNFFFNHDFIRVPGQILNQGQDSWKSDRQKGQEVRLTVSRTERLSLHGAVGFSSDHRKSLLQGKIKASEWEYALDQGKPGSGPTTAKPTPNFCKVKMIAGDLVLSSDSLQGSYRKRTPPEMSMVYTL